MKLDYGIIVVRRDAASGTGLRRSSRLKTGGLRNDGLPFVTTLKVATGIRDFFRMEPPVLTPPPLPEERLSAKRKRHEDSGAQNDATITLSERILDARKVVEETKRVVKFMNYGDSESYERLDVLAFEVVDATFMDSCRRSLWKPKWLLEPRSPLMPGARSTWRCRLESCLKPVGPNQPLSCFLRLSDVCSLLMSDFSLGRSRFFTDARVRGCFPGSPRRWRRTLQAHQGGGGAPFSSGRSAHPQPTEQNRERTQGPCLCVGMLKRAGHQPDNWTAPTRRLGSAPHPEARKGTNPRTDVQVPPYDGNQINQPNSTEKWDVVSGSLQNSDLTWFRWTSIRGCVRECQEHQMYERKAREALGYQGAKERNLMCEAPEELPKQIFREIRHLDEKISGGEMELLERERFLEEWLKEGGMPMWRKGELRLLLEEASLGRQWLDLEVPKQRLNSVWLAWMVEETKLMLEMASLGRQQRKIRV